MTICIHEWWTLFVLTIIYLSWWWMSEWVCDRVQEAVNIRRGPLECCLPLRFQLHGQDTHLGWWPWYYLRGTLWLPESMTDDSQLCVQCIADHSTAIRITLQVCPFCPSQAQFLPVAQPATQQTNCLLTVLVVYIGPTRAIQLGHRRQTLVFS